MDGENRSGEVYSNKKIIKYFQKTNPLTCIVHNYDLFFYLAETREMFCFSINTDIHVHTFAISYSGFIIEPLKH